ncbi:hypothetical protein GOP47_0003299 [Adiantum capillus-veneris]|uniref:Uncharacterized protein n=1 Tax=Adiantum capillus-veneris TaxID=13818 RepID=A0A9D4VD98_ADICA|nr:hypothetical protein GOP47_0003299 [Adiantum capillus-veneris]
MLQCARAIARIIVPRFLCIGQLTVVSRLQSILHLVFCRKSVVAAAPDSMCVCAKREGERLCEQSLVCGRGVCRLPLLVHLQVGKLYASSGVGVRWFVGGFIAEVLMCECG